MEYQVLARKYRPQKFADVVSQGPIVATLKNAIRMKRAAHAYLFCGCRGTGKTTLARLLAKALNCHSLSEDIEPCNTCSSCREIAAGHAMDVLEIDGASHRGIEDIRQINETIGFVPTGGHYKIYLIDEVHMLTKEAFNALLKTLEEPPSHVKFFFCTTEPHKIPATILSRCQRFNLRRIDAEHMQKTLAQIATASGVMATSEALGLIAQRAEGSLRDALSLLDQVIAFEKGTISAKTVTEALGLPSQEICFALDSAGAEQNISALFKIVNELFSSGHNLPYFLEELISHFRMHLLAKCGNITDTRYTSTHSTYRLEQLIQILEILTEGQHTLKSSPSERTALEMLLLRIVRTHQHMPLESLVERLIALEQRLSITENPMPQPEELPHHPQVPPKEAAAQLAKPGFSIQEQSRFDTVMRFAAKELNGSIKKETSHG